jgi:hypothetical protein
MGLTKDHELHLRRRRRNTWLGLVLGGFVALIFGITMVKMSNGQLMEGFDHSLRPSLTDPVEPSE